MYRELLDEFLKVANEISAEELESIAEATLVGLDKMADAELDNLEKMAEAIDNVLEKQAADDNEVCSVCKDEKCDKSCEKAKEASIDDGLEKQALVLSGLLAAGLGLGAGAGTMVGINKLKQSLPAWRQSRYAGKAAKAKAKADIATQKSEMANQLAKEHATAFGFSTENVGEAARGQYQPNNYGGGGRRDRKDNPNLPENRVNMNNPNKEQVAGDIQAIKTKEWLGKNKALVLAGAGGTALLANQAYQTDKKNAELAGAYGAAGRR